MTKIKLWCDRNRKRLVRWFQKNTEVVAQGESWTTHLLHLLQNLNRIAEQALKLYVVLGLLFHWDPVMVQRALKICVMLGVIHATQHNAKK